MEPVINERGDRVITAIVTAIPILSLLVVGWQLWASLLGWNDVFVFLLLYLLTGLGLTVGFHRLLTHRAFKTSRPIRAALAILGSAAIEGPVISWVADHRKHHGFSDRAGDPHSPHVGHGHGWRAAARGLAHVHVGWLLSILVEGSVCATHVPHLCQTRPAGASWTPPRSSSARSSVSDWPGT